MTTQVANARIDELERSLAAALEDLHAKQSECEELQVRVAKLAAGARPAATAAATPSSSSSVGASPELAAWVGTWLAPRLERPPGTRHRWCVRWHEHPEALEVLRAAHEEYARAIADPRFGMGQFLRNTLYGLVERLLLPSGPFAGCSPDHHEPPARLPV